MLKFGSFVAQDTGPLSLGVAQAATAHGGDNEVAMTLYVLDDSGADRHSVGVQMVADVARKLGLELLTAADAADQAKGRS